MFGEENKVRKPSVEDRIRNTRLIRRKERYVVEKDIVKMENIFMHRSV